MFSQGVVSATQLIKGPAYLTSPILSKFTRVIRKSLPIIVLGIYVILVEGADYSVIYSVRVSSYLLNLWFLKHMKRNTDDNGIFSSLL